MRKLIETTGKHKIVCDNKNCDYFFEITNASNLDFLEEISKQQYL